MALLGSRIKELRLSEGLTQTEFGDLFGVVKSTVSLYENNNSVPDDEIKIKICKHFGVSLDYLLGLTELKIPTITLDDLEKFVPEYEHQLIETKFKIKNMSEEQRSQLYSFMKEHGFDFKVVENKSE